MKKILGPAMIPDKEIYRNPNSACPEPHYVFFSAATIAKIRERFHKNKFDNNVNINHSGELIEGVQMSDSFIIDDDNRSHLSAEFQHLPNGTWMVEYLIEDDGLWAKLNSEKLNGFSVEGTFYYGNIQK